MITSDPGACKTKEAVRGKLFPKHRRKVVLFQDLAEFRDRIEMILGQGFSVSIAPYSETDDAMGIEIGVRDIAYLEAVVAQLQKVDCPNPLDQLVWEFFYPDGRRVDVSF